MAVYYVEGPWGAAVHEAAGVGLQVCSWGSV
jgi:hypothetical protein